MQQPAAPVVRAEHRFEHADVDVAVGADHDDEVPSSLMRAAVAAFGSISATRLRSASDWLSSASR